MRHGRGPGPLSDHRVSVVCTDFPHSLQCQLVDKVALGEGFCPSTSISLVLHTQLDDGASDGVIK